MSALVLLLMPAATRPGAAALLSHPFLAKKTTAHIRPPGDHEPCSAMEQLHELARCVQACRYATALQRQMVRLPLIPPERFSNPARQLGLPACTVGLEFNTLQFHYDRALAAAHASSTQRA